ncbi:MAG: hypothetical protein IH613_04985 [Desulfuromonadales bacterium]|nr:hypothetical protein [Desulfuromonadales bacterium]
MIRITSIQQALELRGTIPELAIIRSVQFMGDGYSPEEHGHILVIQEGDDITQIKEIGGIFDDDNLPAFEIIASFVDGESVVFEILFALDSDRTIAVIAEQSCLDDDLMAILQKHSGPPQPLPTLNRRAL